VNRARHRKLLREAEVVEQEHIALSRIMPLRHASIGYSLPISWRE